MDVVALTIGLILGLIIGFAVAWVWASNHAKSKLSSTQATEDELKALLAQQANQHIQNSRSSIESLQQELSRMLDSVNGYESSLSQSSDDFTKNTFFGEHASMFLRNTERKSGNSLEVAKPDNQPKDFANNGSGLFVGNAALESDKSKEN